jgi:hypothetical protein
MQYIISGIESFQEDSTVIKKLYSSRKTSKKERKHNKFNKREQELDDPNKNIKNDETKDLLYEVLDREVVDYGWYRRYVSTSWCCRKICCKKLQRQDRIFDDAVERMNSEIDIVEILKHLRVSRMMAAVHTDAK